MPRMRVEGRKEPRRLEAGQKYYWKVEEAESAYSAKNRDEQIRLVLRVGDKAGTVRVFDTLTFNDNAYYRVELFLKSAGKYPGDGVDVLFSAEDCVGLSGWCVVRDEKELDRDKKETGRVFTRIDKWLEASAQMPDPAWIRRAKLNEPAGTEVTEAAWDDRGGGGDDIPF